MLRVSSRNGEEEECIQEGKKQLRFIHTWDDNTVMDLKEIGRGGMDWTDLAHGVGTNELLF